jgi:hypothetical protein
VKKYQTTPHLPIKKAETHAESYIKSRQSPRTQKSQKNSDRAFIRYEVVGGLIALGLLWLFGRMASTTEKPALEPETTSAREPIENVDTVDRMDKTFLCEGVGGIGVAGSTTISNGGIDLRAGQTHTLIIALAEGDSVKIHDLTNIGSGTSTTSMKGGTFFVSVEDPSANLLKVDETVNHENSLFVEAEYTGDYSFIFRLPDEIAFQESGISTSLTCY